LFYLAEIKEGKMRAKIYRRGMFYLTAVVCLLVSLTLISQAADLMNVGQPEWGEDRTDLLSAEDGVGSDLATGQVVIDHGDTLIRG
jgi:hypothetical protein